MLKALVVEDEQKRADALKRYMEGPASEVSFLRFGQVDTAYSCDKAIELAGGGTLYDLIIYDLELPWSEGGRKALENGRRLVQQVSPFQRSACGIVYSGYTHDEIAVEMYMLGAVRRLVEKPASFDEVLRVAEEAILEAARMTFERLDASYHLQARVHEIMNSFNNILAAASEIERICSPKGDFIPSQSLPIIRQEIENIRRFEHSAETSLRALDSVDMAKREACDIQKIAESCLSYLRHLYPEHQARFGFRVEGVLPTTLGIRQELEQLILLLATNALQATADGGCVVISLAFSKEAGEIVLTVEDDGPGIPADVRDRIFERDFTTRPGGTGQGLFLARAFVWNHGGRIDVDSAEGAGTRVTVRLPVREVPAGA